MLYRNTHKAFVSPCLYDFIIKLAKGKNPYQHFHASTKLSESYKNASINQCHRGIFEIKMFALSRDTGSVHTEAVLRVKFSHSPKYANGI